MGEGEASLGVGNRGEGRFWRGWTWRSTSSCKKKKAFYIKRKI